MAIILIKPVKHFKLIVKICFILFWFVGFNFYGMHYTRYIYLVSNDKSVIFIKNLANNSNLTN
jgi:hypothetical protein